MSMGASPCSAYVLPFTKELCEKVNVYLELENKIIKGIDLFNYITKLEDYYENDTLFVTIGKYTISCTLFHYDSELGDQYDSLIYGPYLEFNVDDIYERKLTPIGKELESNDFLPTFEQWTVHC